MSGQGLQAGRFGGIMSREYYIDSFLFGNMIKLVGCLPGDQGVTTVLPGFGGGKVTIPGKGTGSSNNTIFDYNYYFLFPYIIYYQ